MYGLLAIPDSHLAALKDDTTIESNHRERAAQFCSEFTSGWTETLRSNLDGFAIDRDEHTITTGRKMLCILRCTCWGLAESMPRQGIIPGPTTPLQLQFIMATIRGFVVPNPALCPSGIQSDDRDSQEKRYAHAKMAL
jgi:hypothetical protein